MKPNSTCSRGTLTNLETARKEIRGLTPHERPPRQYMTFTPETPYLAKPCQVFVLPITNERRKA
jgi:hypothetical protein